MSDAAVGSFLQCCTISASVPRGLPTYLARPAFFPALLTGVRCREIFPPVVATFVGGHGDGAIQGKDDELVALPALDFSAWFQRAIDRLPGGA